jgi:hypothetical protein
MQRKWKITVLIWIGMLLVFVVGMAHRQDVDLFIIVLSSLVLLTASIYTLALWISEWLRGKPSRPHHMRWYPRRFLRFALDESDEPHPPENGAHPPENTETAEPPTKTAGDRRP